MLDRDPCNKQFAPENGEVSGAMVLFREMMPVDG